ncbi:MAG TPA: YdeI/OmpD-associated family protein [Candidatus Saccharimonadales bacterium]|jgi:hypothetical protein
MAILKFAGVIKIRGVNPYVDVGKSQAERLQKGWRKPMPVLLTVNGQPKEPWHINMMPAGNGDFYLYLHGAVRKASGTKVGDAVTVEVDFDEAYRNGPQHPMPSDFAAALKKNPAAQANWNALPPSRQKEVLHYLAALKSADAKARNIARALQALSGTSTHFMGRDWNDGS